MKYKLIDQRYRLVRRLGKGGMGSVWLARHERLGNEVAIKIISAEAARNTDSRARFDREARIAVRIENPHVVRMIDHGQDEEGQSYIVMEVLRGESLEQRLKNKKRLSIAETARIVSHVARAMTVAHEAGLVHRDIKPGNIFISHGVEGEVIKVLDFGVAKVTDVFTGAEGVDPTATGMMLGTPFYMSPEQAQGMKTVDHRSDLWALGVVVYECLTGTRPFRAPAIGPLVAQILIGEITPPSAIAPDNVPLEIDAWTRRALARSQAERFQTASELSDAFMVAAGKLDSMQRSAVPLPPGPAGVGTVVIEPEPETLAAAVPITDTGTVIVRGPEEPVLGATVPGTPRVEQAATQPAPPEPPRIPPITPRPSPAAAPGQSRWLLVLGAVLLAVTLGVVALMLFR
jgi:serine/threonine protein kinase